MPGRPDSFHPGQIETRVSMVGKGAERQKRGAAVGSTGRIRGRHRYGRIAGLPMPSGGQQAQRERPTNRTWAEDRQQRRLVLSSLSLAMNTRLVSIVGCIGRLAVLAVENGAILLLEPGSRADPAVWSCPCVGKPPAQRDILIHACGTWWTRQNPSRYAKYRHRQA